jgi:hypothetical protein
MGLWLLGRVLASRGWLTVEGTVVSARVEIDSAGQETSYQPRIEYEYVVGGRLYYSRRMRLAGNTNVGQRESEQIVSQHPRGTVVTVYYDPKDPTRATLKRSFGSLAPYVLILMGVIFTGTAIALFAGAGYRI